MEEVDGIIIVSLKQLGIPLRDGVTSIKQFDSDIFFASVVVFLKAIDPEKKFPTSIPKETARGYRVGETLAKVVKDLGYPHELGFDQFLYPNELDMRKLLSFLMEQMPHQEEGDNKVLDGRSLFKQRIAQGLEQWKSKPFVPSFLVAPSPVVPFHSTPLVGPIPAAKKSKAEVAFWREHLKFVTSQVGSPQYLVGSLVQLSSRDLVDAESRSRVQFDAEEGGVERQRRQGVLRKAVANALNDSVARARGGLGSQANTKDQNDQAKGTGNLASLDELVNQMFGNATKAVDGSQRSTAFEHATEFSKTTDDTQASVLVSWAAQSQTQPASSTSADNAAPAQGEGEVVSAAAAAKAAVLSEKERIERERREKREKLEAEAKAKQEELQLQLDQLSSECARLESHTQLMLQSRVQVQGQLDEEERSTDILEEEFSTHKQSIEMLNNFQENINNLLEIISASGDRLVKLAEEWEKHRVPMLQVYREHKKKLSQRKTECRQKLERVKEMRLEMKQMIQQLHEKDQLSARLQQDVEAMPKSVNRNAYTVRILEIVKNVKKQHVDINNILKDIRDVQKEISQVEEILKRSHLSADEAVFAAAKSDPVLKAAYKLFVDLHTDFTQLIERVEAKGRMTSEIRQLELKSDALASQNHSLNFDKVAADLAKVRKENEALADKLKAK